MYLQARRGERAPLPTAYRRWDPSPRALHSVPLGGPTSVVATAENTRFARWGDRPRSATPKRTLASLVGGPTYVVSNPRTNRDTDSSVKKQRGRPMAALSLKTHIVHPQVQCGHGITNNIRVV